jgi:hypothetical protein
VSTIGSDRSEGLALARRAGMDQFAYNTRVVLPDDSSLRVAVRSGSSPYADHVGIGFMLEFKDNRSWFEGHFSPAKARLIAHHLLAVADLMEGKS